MTEPVKRTLGRKIFDGLAVATLVGFTFFCAVMVYCAANIADLRRRDDERRRHAWPPPFERPPYDR